MRLLVAAVGRAKERAYRTLLDEYYGRVRRYATLDEIELREERDERLVASFERVVHNAGARAELVALDVQGESLGSERFARKLGAMLDRACVPVFALGGAEGLPRALGASATWRLSLGPMTLPHRLARLVLAEQIYRAFTILRGEPYAREG